MEKQYKSDLEPVIEKIKQLPRIAGYGSKKLIREEDVEKLLRSYEINIGLTYFFGGIQLKKIKK